ncbi:hypothetical protein [Cyanobium sp. T1G-Tous]|uniref:hypothetical protein n=1 Tax=Cyanobium sp. T1G-Tous TaxID=2823722 RepID=UPI0020CFC798|nr:hypothetical protein [Cyanobium sp. T1G-Tous]
MPQVLQRHDLLALEKLTTMSTILDDKAALSRPWTPLEKLTVQQVGIEDLLEVHWRRCLDDEEFSHYRQIIPRLVSKTI